MKKIYLKILISIVSLLWIIYFIQCCFKTKDKKESFVPKIQSLYRPYVRNINQNYESFINNYGPEVVMTKMKKWNIY